MGLLRLRKNLTITGATTCFQQSILAFRVKLVAVVRFGEHWSNRAEESSARPFFGAYGLIFPHEIALGLPSLLFGVVHVDSLRSSNAAHAEVDFLFKDLE